MTLIALPAFTDNYIWMIRRGREALVVDPGDATPVRAALEQYGLTLTAILVTHHHGDHTGGILALKTDGVAVYGPSSENIAGITHSVADGDQVKWHDLTFDVVDVGGHTKGHVAYFSKHGPESPQATPIAFVGDTLFSGGCGRVFDGTMAQLYESLQRMATWPKLTRLFSAHEYTLSNLKFALAVEPQNADLQRYQLYCDGLRAAGQPTLPTVLATELAINPFLRCEQPAVAAAVRQHGGKQGDPASVFTALRTWKNTF